MEPLVRRHPDNITYRVSLMHAYFQTKQPERLLQMLKDTDRYFHEDNRWNQTVMAELARSCLQNQLYEQSTTYFKEAIATHRDTHPRRVIGNETLSYYYRDMARAYTGLEQTSQAVDAACGAIVSWGPTHKNRRNAIDELKHVLSAAPDLDHYVAVLDKQSDESAQENPIVRKALGQVYRDKRQYQKAIAQLQLAIEIQPNDTETHQALVACYDQLKNKQGAIQQLLDHPKVNSKMTPSSEGGPEADLLQGGANEAHLSDPAYDTADFNDNPAPGNLRVDYVLPRNSMKILDSGVFWPTTDDPLFRLTGTFPFPTSDHRLVWIDVRVN